MANSRSAEKAARVTVRRTEINRQVRSSLKTYIKNARKALQDGETGIAQETTRLAIAKLDKAGVRGFIHRNTASRTKSRLERQLTALVAKSEPKPKAPKRRKSAAKSPGSSA